MGDIVSSKVLAIARLKTHILEMKLQLQRMDERKLQLADELNKIEENEKASLKDLAETEKTLAQAEGA